MTEPAQLMVFVLQAGTDWNKELLDILQEHWGPIRHKGAWHAFDQTPYYLPEMGEGLHRSVLSFEALIDPSTIAIYKRKSIEVENQYSQAQKRVFNLDMGYMDADKIVLPSCKKGPWKLYWGDGLWLDMVMSYSKGEFSGTPWTFEDFKRNPYQTDLRLIREKYRKALKGTSNKSYN